MSRMISIATTIPAQSPDDNTEQQRGAEIELGLVVLVHSKFQIFTKVILEMIEKYTTYM